MIAPLASATLGHVAERAGVIAVALLAAAVVLGGERARVRATAMVGALVLTPILLLANIWHSPQLHPLRHHPLLGLGAAAGGLVAVGVLTVALRRRPGLLPVAAVAALPFRLPISSGGQTSNLLLPLYLIVAAGTLAHAVPVLAGRSQDDDREPPVGRLEWALMGLVCAYAIQAAYSSDFAKALSQVVFFYVPFALLLVLLRRVTWDRKLLLRCLIIIVALAVAFAGIGFVEYGSRHLLLNPKVISTNQLESYFRVNSLFFDPNIYGRFLAIVMLCLATAMLWTARRRDVVGAAGLLLVLWAGLMTSISQSSIVALLAGLAVVAALRWSVRRTVELTGVLAVAAVAFLLVAGGSVHFNLGSGRSANNSTSGRYTLAKGGVELFGDRPILGFGSGSFATEYRQRRQESADNAASASHTIPITVAAEQGIVGLALYLGLVVACLGRLFAAGVYRSPARVAVAAAFSALLLHTMLYADFLEDPVAWTLLGVGTALWWPARSDTG